jgi:hypothetical protein
VSFAAITVCVASQQVFIVVVYFVIDSVRKLLVTLSYLEKDLPQHHFLRRKYHMVCLRKELESH